MSVAVSGVVPEIFTELVEPKLRVGGFAAPLGLEVRAAVSATLPVKPPDGVTVTVDVFPVVAPASMVTGVALIVKLGGMFSLATKGLTNAGFVVWNAPLVIGKSADWA